MATPPQGHPRPAWDDLIAAFHNHGIPPDDTRRVVQRKTLGRDYRRRVRTRLLEIRDPLRQRWEDLWLRHLDPWSPPSHLPHTCRLCGECDTVSSAASTGANRCARCAQVAACPWPEPPAGPRRRTEEEALHRRVEGAQNPLTRTRGPRGRCPSVDPCAPAGPHIRCAPVARVRALTPTRRRPLQSPQYHATPTGGWAGAHQGPQQSAGGGRPGPGDGRGGGGARGARCRTV